MQQIGSLEHYTYSSGVLTVQASGSQLSLRFLAPDLVRITLRPDGAALRPSIALAKTDWDEVSPQLEEVDEYLRLVTPAMAVEIDKSPIRLRFYDSDGRLLSADATEGGLSYTGTAVAWEQEAPPAARYYGFGQKPGFLDKRGQAMTLWATDEPLHIPDHEELYQAIPFHLVLHEGRAHGLLVDSTARVSYDVAKRHPERISITAEDRYLDAYFFAGPSVKSVLQRYTDLTGRMELPPRWALGYQQCRYSYYPDARVREVAAEMRRREIPCDVIYLDIHYMDGYRVFTWDPERFPDPKGMVSDLAEQGFRTVTIVDPGVKVDGHYPVFRDGVANGHFVCHDDGELFIGTVWPGRTAFPDFARAETRRWWGDWHHEYVNEVGVAGIWNDMNEPSCFARNTFPDTAVQGEDGAKVSHSLVHNAFGMQMGQATFEGLKRLQPEKRPFVLTRSGYAGIQRYAAVWMGDNHSWWEHMLAAMPVCMGMGLSGVPFVGTDIGGFQGDCSGELFARWVQMGAFTPFCRSHTAIDTVDQEPWSFGERVESISREYLRLRYRLLPFLYNEFYKASQTGLPIMRPLLMEYPDDPQTHNLSDQFLVGEDLLVCPVYQPGATKRLVYLPEGGWVDFWTGARITGPAHVVADAPLERMPLYVRAGAILPIGPAIQWVDQQAPAELTLSVFGGADGSLDLYEDEGEGYAYRDGGYAVTPVRLEEAASETILQVDPPEGGYRPARQRLVVRLFTDGQVTGVVRDGQPVPFRVASDGAVEVAISDGALTGCELRFIR